MLCVLAAALAAPRALAHVRRLTDNAAGSSNLVANFMRIDMDTVDDVEIAADTEYVADTDEIGDLCFQRDPSNDALLRFCTAKDAGPLEAFGTLRKPADSTVRKFCTGQCSSTPRPNKNARRLVAEAGGSGAIAFTSGNDGADLGTPSDNYIAIFDVKRMQTIFRVEGRTPQHSTFLVIGDMAVWSHFQPFNNLWDHEMHQWFDIAAGSAVCFANSVFYLKSCQGFPAWKDSQPVKFWCCRPFGKSSVCQGETDPPELVQWRAALANSDDPDERARKFLPLKCYEVSSVPADQAYGPGWQGGSTPSPPGTHDASRPARDPIRTDIGDDADYSRGEGAPSHSVAVDAPPPPPPPGLSTAAGFGVAAAIVLLLAAVAVFVVVRRRRRSLDVGLLGSYTKGDASSTDSGSTPPKVWWRNNRLARRPATDAAAAGAGADSGKLAAAPATRAAAGKGDALLHRHLAALARERHCLASAYLLHTPKAIRQDECGVAVPAEAVADDDREYVAFFYTDTAAFERERAVMAAPEWSEFTVALRAAYPAAGGEPCYAHGAQLPPVVVLEDGESMREWAVGSGSDAVMAVNTLVQVAELLDRLHSKGLVHRDIRPETLVWLPGQLAWCLTSFGFCASHQAVTAIRFTLEYAAPETAHAWEAGASSTTVDKAVDVWALGVAAYELLTQRRAFPAKMTEAEVWAQIAGRTPLPWELLATDAPNHFRARIKGIVLTCLHRDPEQRPSAAALAQALRALLATPSQL